MKVGASAAMIDPARMTVSAPTRIGFLCGPSLRRPSTGVATAPISRLTVSIHWAELTGTSKTSEIVGTSSMPSELTIAVHSAA